jgi:phosphotransferase system  glucose/maltose/N-acetylglucosamine-specific IIC component
VLIGDVVHKRVFSSLIVITHATTKMIGARRPWWVFVVPVGLGIASSYYQFLPLIRKKQREDALKKREEQQQQKSTTTTTNDE